MNIEKLYVVVRTSVVVGGAALGSGGFYAIIIAGMFRLMFDIEDRDALLWIGLPLFIIFSAIGLIYLPKYFRKAGIIS